MSVTVSVIIPTYNEKDNVVPLVERVHRALSGYQHEILIVDDNSRDGTAEVAASLSDRYPVKVLVRKDEKGLATAVVYGLNHTSGDIAVVMDADLQHPPEVVPQLVKAIESGDGMAVASRYVKGGGCPNWDLTRKIVSKTAITIAHLLLPFTRRIRDATSGFFAFRREGVAATNLKPIGFKIMLEVLAMGKFQRVVEVPYVFCERSTGRSKFNTRQQLEYLKHLFSLMVRTGELARFLKFCAVGFSGVFVNIGILWALTEFAGLYYLLSAAVSIEVSIISNFVLNDYFTFKDRRWGQGKSFPRRLLKFNLVSLAGVGINLGVLLVLTEAAGLYYLLSQLCGIVVATMWNYLVNSIWTWR